LDFSTGNIFTEVGVSAPCSNPYLGGPGTLLLELPFFSQDDSALSCKIFTLIPPIYADNIDKVYQLERFPVFNIGTCLTSVPQLELSYQPLTLLSQLGLRPAMAELHY
jgi:hypothetical protein